MKHEAIYHILIDRFFPSKKEDADGNFKGGCLRSVIDHLDYIRKLGMTGIMLTPFYRTAAYHGYHIVDFEQVDPHFGTKEEVRELVDEAHRRGMTVVADFVANHCHKKCRLFADGRHKNWFQFRHDGSYRCFAGIADLPMFDTTNKEVRAYLTQRALELCDMGFDVLRLDHATGPDYGFWKHFRKAIKKKYPHVRLIGEVWGELDFRPHNRLRYFLNRLRYDAQEARQLEYVGILDGVLDFRYQQRLCAAARKGKSITGSHSLCKEIETHFARYPTAFQLWLFLDNHDLNRFLFECDGDKALLREGIGFTAQWNRSWLMFYGTERAFTNHHSIFDGTPYADERVRMTLK